MWSTRLTVGLLLGSVLLSGSSFADNDTLPTPYSAEEIRDSFQTGLEIVTRTWTPEGESLSRMTVVKAADEAVTIADRPVDDSGRYLAPETVIEASWTDLRDHAAFAAGIAKRERHVAFTALGRLEGWLYTVQSGPEGFRLLFFADAYPGPPVIYQAFSSKDSDGVERVLRAEQIRRSVAVSSAFDALPESALPEIPAEALRRLEHSLGRWQVKANQFDSEGNVVATREWQNHAEWLLPGRMVLLTHNAPNLGSVSKTLVFYSLDEEKWYLVDVNQKGELWILSGGLEREMITSAPRPTADGRTVMVRFTHENVEDDSFEALMETSFDDGVTWTRSSRQYLTRVP